MSRYATSISACLILLANSVTPVFCADSSQLNFKMYSPAPAATADGQPAASDQTSNEETKDSPESLWSDNSTPSPAASSAADSSSTPTSESPAKASENTGNATVKTSDESTSSSTPAATDSTPSNDATNETAPPAKSDKVLQGYIRVVPSGTKVPIIMDSAVDSDTSQEGDEFAARTSEDLNIDGSTIVPAGSVIKGRIAQMNSPKHLSRSGSVALKFDTVTTPDNRQITLVANLVARGGVVHAKRGLKDVAIATGTVALPMVLGVGIGALAGGAENSSNKLGRGGGALVGAAVGVAIGVVVLCAKKGKKVDVRPGDELKIELAEDLRMPM